LDYKKESRIRAAAPRIDLAGFKSLGRADSERFSTTIPP